jgi:hypothetical protein
VVELTISEDKLILHVKGADRLWAFKSTLEIPLRHISSVRPDPALARRWWKGIRMPGTYVPGLIAAGTFYQDGKRIFWDVHDPDRAIVIVLHDERYNELVVEVAETASALKLVRDALPSSSGTA